MMNALANRGVALLKAAHFGPTLLVVAISFLLALSVLPWVDSLRIALAIFAGQLVVGWSNDVIDFPLDSEAQRHKKPLVSGKITIEFLKKCILAALVMAFVLSIFSPFGLPGTLLHFLGILSATAYNLKLKSTIFSPLPYIISFGSLPWAIYLSADRSPPIWLYLCFMLFSTAFHFLNVIKDLSWDLNQGINGLPQRLGKKGSLATVALLVFLFFLTIFLTALYQ
jgi:4-hydroxybenzoate polyprenyltransferase